VQEDPIPQGATVVPNDVLDVAISNIRSQYRNYLVVGLLTINHTKAADWPRVQEEAAVGKRFLRQDADVHWITIALNAR